MRSDKVRGWLTGAWGNWFVSFVTLVTGNWLVAGGTFVVAGLCVAMALCVEFRK